MDLIRMLASIPSTITFRVLNSNFESGIYISITCNSFQKEVVKILSGRSS